MLHNSYLLSHGANSVPDKQGLCLNLSPEHSKIQPKTHAESSEVANNDKRVTAGITTMDVPYSLHCDTSRCSALYAVQINQVTTDNC
jgi:hypothetical protein